MLSWKKFTPLLLCAILVACDVQGGIENGMKPQAQEANNAWVVRTDFSDDSAWKKIRAIIQQPVGIEQFRAYVQFVEEPVFQDQSPEQVIRLLPKEYEHSYILLVDQTTISHREHPLLVVDLLDEPGRTFRAIPTEIQSIENNLSISNMSFVDFADSVDTDGIFRGFK